MSIIGVDFSIPATVYVNTETGEVERQILAQSEMTPNGTFRTRDGKACRPPDDLCTRAEDIANGELGDDGMAPDFPGWDWR